MVLSERWRVSDEELQSTVDALQTQTVICSSLSQRQKGLNAMSRTLALTQPFSSTEGGPRTLARNPQLGLTVSPRQHAGLTSWASNRPGVAPGPPGSDHPCPPPMPPLAPGGALGPGGFISGFAVSAAGSATPQQSPRDRTFSDQASVGHLAKLEARLQAGRQARVGQDFRISGPINPGDLHREDTIPGVNGRRFKGASDDDIKIYISLPGIQAMITVWAHPDTPIHRVAAQKLLRQKIQVKEVASLKPETASAAGTPKAMATNLAHAGKLVVGNCPSALPTLLEEQAPEVTAMVADRTVPLAGGSPRCRINSSDDGPGSVASSGSEPYCLQAMIQDITSIAISNQYLRSGSRRLDLQTQGDDAVAKEQAPGTLCEAGINHGSTIVLNLGANESYDTVAVQKHMLLQAKQNRTARDAWVMPRWEHQKAPKLFGEAKTAGRLRDAVHFHDYTSLSDVGSIDPCNRMRRKFG